jgi:hypothetical protein
MITELQQAKAFRTSDGEESVLSVYLWFVVTWSNDTVSGE